MAVIDSPLSMSMNLVNERASRGGPREYRSSHRENVSFIGEKEDAI